MNELEKRDRELDDIGGRRLVTFMLITLCIVVLVIVWLVIYTVKSNQINKEINAMSKQAVEEADPNELIDNIKVKIGDTTISYKDLTEDNCEAGVVECFVYYAGDVVTSKNGYIVFDNDAKEVTYEGEDYIKIIVPKKGNANE